MSSQQQRRVEEANENEMHKQLQQLSMNDKQARIQAMIDKQDLLRPIISSDHEEDDMSNDNLLNVPYSTQPYHNDDDEDNIDFDDIESKSQSQEISIEDEEAMKAEFTKYTKEKLQKQITKQFLLRLPSSDEDDMLNEEDINDMKEQFNLYNKEQLNKISERQYNLRSPQVDQVNSNKFIIPQDHQPTELNQNDEIENNLENDKNEHLLESINTEYQAVNKAILSYRSTKQLPSITIDEPEIMPLHKNRFNILMKDIGILNPTIVQDLWQNIENIVEHDDDNIDDEEDDDDNEEEELQNNDNENENEVERVNKNQHDELKEKNDEWEQKYNELNIKYNAIKSKYNLFLDDDDDELLLIS